MLTEELKRAIKVEARKVGTMKIDANHGNMREYEERQTYAIFAGTSNIYCNKYNLMMSINLETKKIFVLSCDTYIGKWMANYKKFNQFNLLPLSTKIM